MGFGQLVYGTTLSNQLLAVAQVTSVLLVAVLLEKQNNPKALRARNREHAVSVEKTKKHLGNSNETV